MRDIPYYWRLSGFYFFYFALLGTLVPYWALYLQESGFSAPEIGLLMALPQVTKLFAPVMWGWLADRTGRRLHIIRLGNFCAALVFAYVFYADHFWSMAAALITFSFFWNAVLAQFEALTLESLGELSSRYGHVRLWGSVGFVLTVCVIGYLLDFVSIMLVPWAMLVTLWLIWLSTLLLPDHSCVTREGAVNGVGGLWRLVCQPPVLVFFLCSFLMQLSHGPYYTFFTIYLDQLGIARVWTGALWSLGVVAEIALFMVMHRLLGRFSLRNIIVGSLFLAALRWLLIAYFAQQWPVLLFAQLLHAATFGAFHAASIAWVHKNFRHGHSGQGQALYSSVGFGAGWALGAVLAGLLWNQLGPITFLWAATVALLAMIVAFKWLPKNDLVSDEFRATL